MHLGGKTKDHIYSYEIGWHVYEVIFPPVKQFLKNDDSCVWK